MKIPEERKKQNTKKEKKKIEKKAKQKETKRRAKEKGIQVRQNKKRNKRNQKTAKKIKTATNLAIGVNVRIDCWLGSLLQQSFNFNLTTGVLIQSPIFFLHFWCTQPRGAISAPNSHSTF